MHWSSKMQIEKALSTTEAEYIALFQAMREILPIIWLMEEARQQGIPV
jgi:deoxyinosine 3'endonuclease (endonuclease V)